MSTPAAIIVEGIDSVKVYKHFDGDPDSTLPWLEAFNKAFTESRGDDPEYKFAQLLRSSARNAEQYGLDDSLYTGWGVIPLNDKYGEEFTYILRSDGAVEWYKGSNVDQRPEGLEEYDAVF